NGVTPRGLGLRAGLALTALSGLALVLSPTWAEAQPRPRGPIDDPVEKARADLKKAEESVEKARADLHEAEKKTKADKDDKKGGPGDIITLPDGRKALILPSDDKDKKGA